MTQNEIVIIGAGIAGLSAALRLAPHPVTVLTGAPLGQGAATAWAQGGIAAALGPDDSPDMHAADTIAAGSGCVDPDRAYLLAQWAGNQIAWLEKIGVRFDKDKDGHLLLGREAAHSRHRIVHAGGDGTGAAVMQALIAAAERTPSITFHMGGRATDLQVTGGKVTGVILEKDHVLTLLPARAVILATGGIGQLYSATTNPPSACGEGLAIAARAGAELRDLEFVQFHPTALAVGEDPMPLLTEALRGDGAILINETGQRFMTEIHPAAELAPRDVVARAIWQQLQQGHTPMLDARQAVGKNFPEKFPFIYATCQRAGLDPVTAPLPIMPAAHYHMGGVTVDARGRSSLPGLWVCGETASTGVHGANRLASNSLLEALVFAQAIAQDLQDQPAPRGKLAEVKALGASAPLHDDRVARMNLRRMMFEKCGLIRAEEGLSALLAQLFQDSQGINLSASLQTTYLVAAMITLSALHRKESRGSHTRSDYPEMLNPPRHQTITFAGFQNELYQLYGKNWPTRAELKGARVA